MKATATAHPNIALVKYWGKRDQVFNLPAAPSLSMTLGGLTTRTSVEFLPELATDSLELDGEKDVQGAKLRRVSQFLDLVRAMAGTSLHARVQSSNDFPTGAGLASSASGFAALALSATRAAGLYLDERALSILARRGSGSAGRSIFGGFVEIYDGVYTRDEVDEPLTRRRSETDWSAEEASEMAFARQFAPPEHWDLRCVIAVTSAGEKDVGSTEGMVRTQQTSAFYEPWVQSVPADIERARAAVLAHDFDALAQVAEASCLRMHASAMAAEPGIVYWNATTVSLVHRVRAARADGVPVFFTIDAGPQVKVFCPAHALDACRDLVSGVQGVRQLLIAHPGGGAQVE